ncbi:MAG: coproporphyrinogen III oxidase, partial [Pseudomonadota bacterium]
ARAVGALRAVGITGVNFDLIYGLPHQTVETLLETVSLCADMAPDRIALFGYAHVPWMAKKQRLIDESALPGPAARLAQARAAAEALEGFGYTAIGLDHFALPRDPLSVAARDGTLRRNFQGYTTDQAQTMLGFGATSIGRTPTTFTQNTTETGAWARAVEAGELPLARGVTLSADDQLRGAVIERLMCQGRVDLNAEAARFGLTRDYFRDAEAALDEFSHDGLITYEGGVVTARPSGLQLIRVIASAFDAYFQASAARHALAV